MKFTICRDNTILKDSYFETSWGTFHIFPRLDYYWRHDTEKQIILGWLCWEITFWFEFEEKKEKKLRKQKKPKDALMLKDYSDKESKYFEVVRSTRRPDYIPEWDWLSCNNQEFDYITEWTDNEEEEMRGIAPGRRDNGLFIKDMYKACPVCGSRNISMESYNNLCPEQLAGSSGYYDVCDDCGYRYRNVLCQS